MTHTLITGDAREVLASCKPGEIQTVVTSPPYYGQRWYEEGGTKYRCYWGGSEYPECPHNWIETYGPNMTGGTGPKSSKQVTNGGSQFGNQKEEPPSRLCTFCGKWWGELGREPNPTMYIEHLMEVFDALWPSLHPTGTFWLNLGDSYAGSGKGPTGHNGIGNQERRQGFKSKGASKLPPGYKNKDLLGLPFLVANALRVRGWYYRQTNIWEKDNPFPESVKDRSSTVHEYIFQFSKSRRYYYDHKAVAEPIEPFIDKDGILRTHKNRRSVWHFKTQPVRGHTAVFPEALPDLCIKAGSRPGDLVADIFSGSATTGIVAGRLGRRYLGIDIIPDFNALGEKRLREHGILAQCQRAAS